MEITDNREHRGRGHWDQVSPQALRIAAAKLPYCEDGCGRIAQVFRLNAEGQREWRCIPCEAKS